MENTNEMKIIFDSRPENEGLARVAAAAFCTQLNPTLEERPVVPGVGIAPHHVHQILPTVDPPGIAHQEFNKIVFLGGQVHSLPAPDGNPFLRVQGQVPSCQYASLLALNPGCPPQ